MTELAETGPTGVRRHTALAVVLMVIGLVLCRTALSRSPGT